MMLENGIDAFKSAFLSVQPVVKIRPARQTSDKQPQRKLEAVKDFVVYQLKAVNFAEYKSIKHDFLESCGIS